MRAAVLIVNCAEPGISEFCEPLENILAGAGTLYETCEYADTRQTNMSRYDGAILSGSPRGNDIVDHHQAYFRWIKTFGKPLFGICAGFHIIGRLYGCELLRSVEKEVGDFFVSIVKDDPIFKNFPERFNVRQSHHDSITLPANFILLATSGKCKVEAIKHRSAPIYATQFHPEVKNRAMILNFIDIVKTRQDKNNK